MRHALVLALLAAPVAANAQPEPPPQSDVRMFDSMESFCAQTVFVDRIKGAPPVIVEEPILVAALREGLTPACRWRAGMLLGYLGTDTAPAALIEVAQRGVEGPASGQELLVVAGALHGLGIFARVHPESPAVGAALAFLDEATEPEFWNGSHITWSRTDMDPDVARVENARMAIVGLALSARGAAWRVLADLAGTFRDTRTPRAQNALALWCEAAEGVTAPMPPME